MKAFTLVELLAVIIIIGIIVGITVPIIGGAINDSKEKAYEEQVNQIESIARNWGVSNTNLLPDTGVYYLKLDTLRGAGLLDNINLKNPKDNSIMQGCVLIQFDIQTNQYTYTYSEVCE